MRMALVEIIGMLIREIALSDEGEQESREKKINNLFELLTERFLDLSSYVRAKVINTLSRLCECVQWLAQVPILIIVAHRSLPVKFPKQRLQSAELTIGALEDKASSVRRYAIVLLTKLILTHPYGLMHGGLLRIEEWEARYNSVSTELEQAESREAKPAVETEDAADVESDEDEGEEEEEEEDEDEMEDVETVLGSPSKATPKATPARTPRARLVVCVYPCCSYR
jgi:condensin complex subunit 1